MATAAKTETLSSAMASAFAEIEGAAKAANNPHFKSKYADLSAVIDAIKPALINNRLFFTQMTHDSEGGVCIETVIHHEGGDSMSCGRLFVPASKQDAQGFGSALTYARRYSLMTAFGVPAEDDDGNAAAKSAPAANDEVPAKIEGITKIKERLRALRTAGEAVEDLGAFNALVRDNRDDLQKIKDGKHAWWTGDGGEDEGFAAWITRRREELADGMYPMLIKSMKECDNLRSLANWRDTNDALINELDGAESRKFQLAYELHESGLLAAARVHAG